MNTQNNIPEPVASNSPGPRGTTVLYEDRAAGLRAKRFSDLLRAALGDGPGPEPDYWRLELLDLPGLVDEISGDAANSEFLIFSLNGGANLSRTIKLWLENWMANAEPGMTSLIALFDPIRSVAPHAEATRYYLRQAAAEAGVAFFAHCVAPPTEFCAEILDESDDKEPLPLSKRSRRRRSSISLFPTAVIGGFWPAAMAV